MIFQEYYFNIILFTARFSLSGAFYFFNDKNLIILTDLFSSHQLTFDLLFPAGAGEGDGGYGHSAHEKEPKCLRANLS